MRRTLLLAVAAAVALAVLAAAGRAERDRWADTQRDGMNEVVDALGGRFLVNTVSDTFDDPWRPGIGCVRYAAGGDPYAMQVCFDPHGRVTEAYDERSGEVEIFDLHVDPDASGLRIDPQEYVQIRSYVRKTQDEMRRAAEREKLRQELQKAQASRK